MGFFEITDGLGEFFAATLEFFRDIKENIVFIYWVFLFFFVALLWFAYLAALIWIARKVIIFVKWFTLFAKKAYKSYEGWLTSESLDW